MDIERLTKTQIILLTLLVSFVTSIATGIVTVTLLDQAPPAITQTINRVVERTVERVVPNESQGASVVVQEKTVVVKEEDLITGSVERNTKSFVRISTASAEGAEGVFVGVGFVVAREGFIAVDTASVEVGGSYQITTEDGNIFTATVVHKREGASVAFLSIEQPEEQEQITFTPVAFADLSTLKLGQTVLSLGGSRRVNVGMGIISGMVNRDVDIPPQEEGGEPSTTEVLTYIDTTLAKATLGSPLVNIFGEVIGMHTADARRVSGAGSFTPVNEVSTELAVLTESQANKETGE